MIEKSLFEENIAIIFVSGSDSRDFLHRLTTQDIKNMQEGQRASAALLRANSQILHLFTIEFKADGFYLYTEKSRALDLQSELEKMHFAEKLEIKILDKIVLGENAKLSEDERIEKGFFKFGVDITEKNLILEAPLSSYVHRDKGCYPGQEVVERVFTYGQVAKKLVGIKLSCGHKGETLKFGDPITKDQKKIGTITSATDKLALALVQKSHYQDQAQTDQGEVFKLRDSF